MYPQVLLRRAADCFFEELVQPQRIRSRVVARIILQRRMKDYVIAAGVVATIEADRHHRGAAQPRDARCGRHGGGRHAEEWHEHRMPATVVLIWRIPDHTALP